MKQKLCFANLKSLSKGTRVVFFVYFHLFQRFSSFCSNIDDITNHFSTKINHKIKNILGNIIGDAAQTWHQQFISDKTK